MNEETYRFIARIIALKEIFKNPKNYGFYVTDDELYPQLEFSEVKVDYSIKDLVSFAKSNGINYKLLKIFNPWLRNSSLINKNKKTYILKIAKGNSALVNEE